MYAPKNKLLLTLDKRYTDEIILEGGLKLYLDPSYRPEWNVTVSGTIAALPKEGMPGFEIGDKVYFTYHVVNERTWEDDKQFFVRNTLGDEWNREYTDKLGGTIKVMRFPNGKGFAEKWAGSYIDERGKFIDGCQGAEKDVENWMAANFKYGYSQEMKYKNLLEVDGKDYWMAKKNEVFAVKKKGQLQAVPGYAICKETRIDIGTRMALEYGLQRPDEEVVLVPQDRGEIVSMGECTDTKVSAKAGDVVLFPTKLIEKYVFDNHNYWVVKHKRLLAVVQN